MSEVTTREFVGILTGNNENLIKSSTRISNSLAQKIDVELGALIVFDCISRALFTHEEFNKELHAMSSGFGTNSEMFGCLVFGKISNLGAGYLEFYNKTSVIAAL